MENSGLKPLALALALFALAAAAPAQIQVGEPLPEVQIDDKGMLVPETGILDDALFHRDGTPIGYRPWNSAELTGKVRTVYHLAARIGIDDINAHYIDALVAANLPERLSDSPYKTLTLLNTGDALWGTTRLAQTRMEASQKEFAYAEYVIDAEGRALAAWGLQPRNSAVIVVGADGRVLFFREGKLSDEDVAEAVALVQAELELLRPGGELE